MCPCNKSPTTWGLCMDPDLWNLSVVPGDPWPSQDVDSMELVTSDEHGEEVRIATSMGREALDLTYANQLAPIAAH